MESFEVGPVCKFCYEKSKLTIFRFDALDFARPADLPLLLFTGATCSDCLNAEAVNFIAVLTLRYSCHPPQVRLPCWEERAWQQRWRWCGRSSEMGRLC